MGKRMLRERLLSFSLSSVQEKKRRYSCTACRTRAERVKKLNRKGSCDIHRNSPEILVGMTRFELATP